MHPDPCCWTLGIKDADWPTSQVEGIRLGANGALDVGSYSPSFPQPGKQSLVSSLPEFMNFKLFGKTILVLNKKFKPFFWPTHSGRQFPHPGKPWPPYWLDNGTPIHINRAPIAPLASGAKIALLSLAPEASSTGGLFSIMDLQGYGKVVAIPYEAFFQSGVHT